MYIVLLNNRLQTKLFVYSRTTAVTGQKLSFIPCKQDGMYKGTLFLGKTCLQGFSSARLLYNCIVAAFILQYLIMYRIQFYINGWSEYIGKLATASANSKSSNFPYFRWEKNLNDLLLSDKMPSQHMGSDAVSAVVLGDRSSRSCSWISGCTAIGTCYSGHRPFNVCHLYEWNRQGR